MQTDEQMAQQSDKVNELLAAVQPDTTAESGVPPIALAYNGMDRNAWLFGWNPQQELWNGRLAMIGFVAYLLWDLAGYSVVRDALHLMR